MEVIQLTGLTKTYAVGGNKIHALSCIDLQIKENELVAIIGASGSGKSTMLNILGCLDSPTSGSYYLNNKAVHNLEDEDKARIRNSDIGFIFQNFNLLPRYTAIENVMLPLEYAGIDKNIQKQMAEDVLEMVDLKQRMFHKPNELSGGQRQRVAIARALVNKPSIILADEPTGNLDSKSAKSIMLLLREIHKQGNTVIIVTHDNDIAQKCERVIRVSDGKIVEDYLTASKKSFSETTQPAIV